MAGAATHHTGLAASVSGAGDRSHANAGQCVPDAFAQDGRSGGFGDRPDGIDSCDS